MQKFSLKRTVELVQNLQVRPRVELIKPETGPVQACYNDPNLWLFFGIRRKTSKAAPEGERPEDFLIFFLFPRKMIIFMFI